MSSRGSGRSGPECVVSGVSPLLSTEEMEYQLKDSEARGLVTLDAIFAGRLTKIADSLPKLKVVAAASIGDFLPPVKRVLGKLLKKFPTGEVTPLAGKQVYRIKEIVNDSAFSDKDPGVEDRARRSRLCSVYRRDHRDPQGGHALPP